MTTQISLFDPPSQEPEYGSIESLARVSRETVPLVGLETMDEQELWNLYYRATYNGPRLTPVPSWPACEIMTAIRRRSQP